MAVISPPGHICLQHWDPCYKIVKLQRRQCKIVKKIRELLIKNIISKKSRGSSPGVAGR